MNKKLLLKRFGKVFLLIGFVFAISGIENANAQVQVRCIREENRGSSHSHNIKEKYCSTYDQRNPCSKNLSWKEADGYIAARDTLFDGSHYFYTTSTIYNAPSSINIPVCVAWALFINGQQVNTVDKFLEMIPPTQLLRLYDPNMLRN